MKRKIVEAAIDEFVRAVGENNLISESGLVEKLSRDFFWYSPILTRALKDKKADLALRISKGEKSSRMRR